MTRLLALVAVVAAVGCGDDLSPPPPTLSAGPVTIDTQTMTITVASSSPLVFGQFLSIGDVGTIDDNHYYDPRGDAQVHMAPIARARGLEGDWLVLDEGTRIRLTACLVADCALLEIDASKHANAVQMRMSLPKDAAEALFGTGDAPDRPNVAGTTREMQLRVDVTSDSSLNETHVPVPLVLWPHRGAGLFIADDRPGALDLGASADDVVHATFTLPVRGVYRVHLFTANAPLELVRQYTALTATPAVPPRWAFAPQQWRNEWSSSAEVLGDASAMRTRHIPGSVMWIDNPWETGYNTFVVDEGRFAQPAALLSDLAAQGYKVLFWSTPYVGTATVNAADHAEGIANHYFVTDDGNLTIDYPWANGPGAMVDFTRDGATAWWRERIARVTGLGAAGFKLDYGEELTPDVGGSILLMRLAKGDNEQLHNRYSGFYHEAYLGAFQPGEGFVITRTGAWGEQATNTAIWPGDLAADFSEHGVIVAGKRSVGGMPTAVSRGLSLSVSGYPFYGSDIGGFRGFPSTEVLLRWAEYAAFGTIMQLGGGGDSHNPWDATLFAPGADAIYKTYADLHMQLNPLLWTLALRAGTDGTPVTRPAKFVYDCACDDAMFLLGDDLVVAPVVTAGTTQRAVVLPPGVWIDHASGAATTADGHRSITVASPLDVLPRWQRAGSFVPMFTRAADTLLSASAAGVTSYADPAFGGELRLVYAPGPAVTTTLHDAARATADGVTFTVTGGAQYTVFTLDIDGRGQTGVFAMVSGVTADSLDLPAVASDAALLGCAAPGCWWFDAAQKHLQARVFAPLNQTRTLFVH